MKATQKQALFFFATQILFLASFSIGLRALGAQEIVGHLCSYMSTNHALYDSKSRDYLFYANAPLTDTNQLKFLPLTLGVIDSGVDENHPQLRGLIHKQRDFTGEGLQDVLGHGTLVTIIAAGESYTNGAFPKVITAKVATSDGQIIKSNLINAIKWMAEEQVDVINLSLAFEGVKSNFDDLCETMAHYSNIIFTVAAGNTGPGREVYPCDCGSLNVICVGALEDGKPAPWSGTGAIHTSGAAILLKKPDYDFVRARNLLERGFTNEAKATFYRLAKHDKLPAAWFALGMLDLTSKKTNYSSMLKKFQHAAEGETEFKTLALMYAGWAYENLKKHKEAKIYLSKSIDRDPANAYAHYMLAQVYVSEMDPKQALNELKEAERLGLTAIDLLRQEDQLESQLRQESRPP